MGKVSLKDFKELTCDLQTDIRVYCQKAADKSKNDLQKVQWHRNRKNRQYSKGWDWGFTLDTNVELTATVHNYTDWQLTWLLEHGHLVTNKVGGIGWAAPYPHIEPVFKRYSKEFVEDMSNINIHVEILD